MVSVCKSTNKNLKICFPILSKIMFGLEKSIKCRNKGGNLHHKDTNWGGVLGEQPFSFGYDWRVIGGHNPT